MKKRAGMLVQSSTTYSEAAAISPIKDEMKITFNNIQKNMVNIEDGHVGYDRKRKRPPKQIAKSKKGRYTLVSNLPQDQLTKKNKMKKCRKRAAQIVNFHESASAELESC